MTGLAAREVFNRLAEKWQAHRSARAALAELDGMDPSVVGEIARESGLDVADLRVGFMTCYDLRFPELGRALVEAGAEVFVVPAAWVAGEGKLDHWRTLVTARAIENTVAVAAAAQSGERYTGHSMIVAADGSRVEEAGEGDAVLRAELSPGVIAQIRDVNPSLQNRRM